jgi:DNA-binding transcriptional MerR regulator
MGIHQPIRKIVTPEIPDKLYFRIGDVARLCQVPAYVLRFWETEFPQLRPNKGGTGQRLYRKRDVEMALRIKSLLYDQGYTIPGARQVFKAEAKAREAAALPLPDPAPLTVSAVEPASSVTRMDFPAGSALSKDKQLAALRSEMRSLLGTLSRPVSTVLPASENKVKPMRPRLVVDPRFPRPDSPFSQLEQRELFSSDSPDSLG